MARVPFDEIEHVAPLVPHRAAELDIPTARPGASLTFNSAERAAPNSCEFCPGQKFVEIVHGSSPAIESG
jgi:hypothetical protein